MNESWTHSSLSEWKQAIQSAKERIAEIQELVGEFERWRNDLKEQIGKLRKLDTDLRDMLRRREDGPRTVH